MNASASTRLGYVVSEFPPVGDERLLGELLELERRGVEVSVFALSRPESSHQPATAPRLQARVVYLPTRAAVKERQAWIRSQVADIDHLHAYSAQQTAEMTRSIAELTGIPYSFSVEPTDLGPGGVRRRELRAHADAARFIVARSAASVDMIVDLCDENVVHKTHCLYHGLNFTELPPVNQLRRADAVLAVAGTYGHDGIGDLLVAMAAVRRRGRSTELTIIAPEHRHTELLRDIEKTDLKNSVQVVAMPSEPALFELMRQHTLLVAPWRAVSEPADVPHVILQAIAAGLCVVGSDLPGIREVVEDGWSGRLLPPGDATWLAGAIETLLDNARLRHRMARLARQRLDRDFSRPRNGYTLSRLFAATAVEHRWAPRVTTGSTLAAARKRKRSSAR